MSAVIACMHLKHNSCRMWPIPHSSVICVELLEHCRQPITSRLATHRSNTTRLRERWFLSACAFSCRAPCTWTQTRNFRFLAAYKISVPFKKFMWWKKGFAKLNKKIMAARQTLYHFLVQVYSNNCLRR